MYGAPTGAPNVAPTLAPAPTPYTSPDTIALQRAYAKALLENSMADKPISSWSQGVSGMVDALVGGLMARKANERDNALQAGENGQFTKLLLGDAAPVSSAGNGMVPGAAPPQAPASPLPAATSGPTPSGGLVSSAAPVATPPAVTGAPAIGAGRMVPNLDPAQKAAAIAILNNPRASDAHKAYALSLLKPITPDYGFQVVDGNLVRTEKNTGAFDVPYKAEPKPSSDYGDYLKAKGEGFTGNYEAWQIAMKNAGRTQMTTQVGANAMETAMVKRYTDITDEGNKAQEAVATFDRMGQLAKDPNFYSGAGGNPLLFIKQGISALGGDPNAASPMEEFAGLSHKVAIASMGGSLGTGFSNADRSYVDDQMPNLDTSLQGNLARIEINQRIAARKVLIAEKADDYVIAHGNLDAGFNKEMKQFAEANPLFADLPKPSAAPAATPPAAVAPAAAKTHPPTGWGPEWDHLTPEEQATVLAKRQRATPAVPVAPAQGDPMNALTPPPGWGQ